MIVWILLKELLADRVSTPLNPVCLKVSIGLDVADFKCNGFVDTVASIKEMSGGEIAAFTYDDDVAAFFTDAGV